MQPDQGSPPLMEAAKRQGARMRPTRKQQAGLARMLPGSLARVPPKLVRGLGTTVHAQIGRASCRERV